MGRTLVSILIAVSFLLSGTNVLSYPTPVDFDGTLLRWDIGPDDGPITYEIKASDEDDLSVYGNLISDAAETWNAVESSYVRYEEAQEGQIPHVTINLNRTIEGGSVSSGYALFDEYSGNKPSHCSIYILIDNSFSQNSIAKTILHEMGHCLGLGHSLIPEAIMSYQLKKNQFALDIDDEAAVTRLYPASGDDPELPPGCAIAAKRFVGAPSTILWLLIPLAGAVISGFRASGRSKAWRAL